jgi:hypothetical protein
MHNARMIITNLMDADRRTVNEELLPDESMPLNAHNLTTRRNHRRDDNEEGAYDLRSLFASRTDGGTDPDRDNDDDNGYENKKRNTDRTVDLEPGQTLASWGF